MDIKKLIESKKITFCQMTEEEYAAIYYKRMNNQGWATIADSAKAHCVLAKNSIYALKYEKSIIATLSAAKSPAFKLAYMVFFIHQC